MKNVYVTLTGEGCVWSFESVVRDPEILDNLDEIDLDKSVETLEDDGVLNCDLWELPFVSFYGINVLLSKGNEPVWDESDDDAVVITKEVMMEFDDHYLRNECKLTMPLWCNNSLSEGEISECFCIELEDDEEFDPKKLTVVAVNGQELEQLDEYAVTTHIIYDGKKIPWEDPQGYNHDNWEPDIETEWAGEKGRTINSSEDLKQYLMNLNYYFDEFDMYDMSADSYFSSEGKVGDRFDERWIDEAVEECWDPDCEERGMIEDAIRSVVYNLDQGSIKLLEIKDGNKVLYSDSNEEPFND